MMKVFKFVCDHGQFTRTHLRTSTTNCNFHTQCMWTSTNCTVYYLHITNAEHLQNKIPCHIWYILYCKTFNHVVFLHRKNGARISIVTSLTDLIETNLDYTLFLLEAEYVSYHMALGCLANLHTCHAFVAM